MTTPGAERAAMTVLGTDRLEPAPVGPTQVPEATLLGMEGGLEEREAAAE
jgi:hypothetical protein